MLQNIYVRVHILMILLSTLVDRHRDFEGRCCLHVQGESKSQEKERFTIYGSLLKASLSLYLWYFSHRTSYHYTLKTEKVIFSGKFVPTYQSAGPWRGNLKAPSASRLLVLVTVLSSFVQWLQLSWSSSFIMLLVINTQHDWGCFITTSAGRSYFSPFISVCSKHFCPFWIESADNLSFFPTLTQWRKSL